MTSRRGMLAVVAVAAVAVAVAVALTTKKSPRVRPASAPAGSGVAVIEPAKGRIGSFLRVRTAPGGIAVGDGAVWLLDAENGTVSRLDPETGKVGSPIETDGDPSDIAAGEGALWVSNEGTSVSRIDAKTRKITGTEVLPGLTPSASPSLGFPRLSVGAGGVWMIDPNGSVIRLDARTGRRVATVATGGIPSTIAAGVEGVWFVSSQNDAVMRIDPATNRVAQTVPVNSEFLAGIAVGAGAVWVASTRDRLVWRISPGQHPIARAIHVGMRAQYVAFGAGSVWTGNAMDGTVSRIDPRTNRVTATITAGATQALAAGPEAAWVSVAAGTSDGALPATTCSEVASGGDRPDVLIASDLTLRGIDAADTPALVDTISFVLRRHGFRAGRYVVGYQSCDDATAQSDDFEPRSCAANASAYAHAEHLVAVIGPYESLCADAQIAILNRAPGSAGDDQSVGIEVQPHARWPRRG